MNRMCVNPLLLRSSRAAKSQSASRYPSPASSSEEEVSSEYLPSPITMPSRAGFSSKKRQRDLISPKSPTPLVDVEEFSPSQSSSSSVFVKKGKNPVKGKKGGGGRKGEPRREQNMAAQKKYRDKRVNTAHLVSALKLMAFSLISR